MIFKRKFRWVLEGTTPHGILEPLFAKVSSRPEISEIPVPFQTVSATFFEAEPSACSVMIPYPGEEYAPDDKLGEFKMTLYDGCGIGIEEWKLLEAYVSSANFTEDYSSNSYYMEFSIRYRKCEYKALWTPESTSTVSCPIPHNMMGMGTLGAPKVKCPQCQHEFSSPNLPTIIF